MTDKSPVESVRAELEKGMRFKKCRKCGCMREALDVLASYPPSLREDGSGLLEDAELWLMEMQPIKYACLGCKYCYPVVATEILSQAFPGTFSVQFNIAG